MRLGQKTVSQSLRSRGWVSSEVLIVFGHKIVDRAIKEDTILL